MNVSLNHEWGREEDREPAGWACASIFPRRLQEVTA